MDDDGRWHLFSWMTFVGKHGNLPKKHACVIHVCIHMQSENAVLQHRKCQALLLTDIQRLDYSLLVPIIFSIFRRSIPSAT